MTQFIELKESELMNLDGGASVGSLLKAGLKSFTGFWLAGQVIENWDAVKEGFTEGWNSVKR